MIEMKNLFILIPLKFLFHLVGKNLSIFIDFPAVNWVIQYDFLSFIYTPFSTETYIHRVGRTAHYYYFAKGKSLLFLLPSEKNFINKLKDCKVEITKQKIAQIIDIKAELVSILAKFPECRQLAIKAFVTYLQSIQIHQDGDIFQLEQIIAQKDEFAASFGLLQTPVISLGDKKKKVKLMGPIKSENDSKQSLKKELDEIEENSENDEQEVAKDEEDMSFLVPVESDWEDDEEEEVQKMVPTIIEFLEPGTPIPMEEFTQWRERLKNLLHPPTQAVPKQKYQKIKKRKQDKEEMEEEEIEEEEQKEPIDVESLLLHELD